MSTFGQQFTNFQKLRLKGSEDASKLNMLSRVSGLGVVYNKKALKKKVAETDDPRLETDEYQMLAQYMGQIDARYASTLESSYYMFDEIRKRNKLIELSLQPEIEEILDTLTDEVCVNTPEDKYFASPVIDAARIPRMKKEALKALEESMEREFPRIYRMLNFSKEGAWETIRNYLVWGKIAYEIVYDDLDDPKRIIAILPVDALTLTELWKDGVRYWIQEPKFGINVEQRVLHDSQIIMITWDVEYGRLSYTERLLRYFNVYRIMERTKINWYITNSQFRTLFVIPTAGKGRARAAKTLSSAMNRYKDDIEFDEMFGTAEINGQNTIPANKEYWMVETDSGKPEISQIGGEGHDMSDMNNISFFERRLYKISKIPIDRFDPNSSDSWNLDATSQKRQEIKFANFVDRIRTKISPMMLKPLIIQLILEYPGLANNFDIIDAITLRFVKNNVFDELSQMDIMEKKVDFVDKLSSAMTYQDESGREHHYFARSWLAQEYLGLTSAQILANAKLRKAEEEQSKEEAKTNIEEFGEDMPLEGSNDPDKKYEPRP